MGMISAAVDRLLHTTARQPREVAGRAALQVHLDTPVVDLVAGTVLFRRQLAAHDGRGHVDLDRLRAGGVRVLGLTIATRFPDLRGSLSRFHFRSLGARSEQLASNMALAEWLIERIHGWCAERPTELRLVRTKRDLEEVLAPTGPLGLFIGVQGGHVLDGRLANLARLRQLGVLMFAPAHVMDNALVGSSTGAKAGGLTGQGRELIVELERLGMLVDLAHMSPRGIEQSLQLCDRPALISHAGLRSRNDRVSRWRRYSPHTRNVPDWAVHEVARAGGLVGLVLSTQLLGGEAIDDFVVTAERALQLAGPAGVGLGSDMDGALRTLVDAAGLPRLSAGLLAAGHEPAVVSGVMGGNALRLISGSLIDGPPVPVAHLRSTGEPAAG